MPLKGFIGNNNQKVSFDDAISGKVEIDNWSRDLLWNMWKASNTNYHANNTVTVTSVQSCIRKCFLERRINFWSKPENLYYSLRGSKLHSTLEPMGQLDQWMSEIRFFYQLSEAIPDCLDCKGTGWTIHNHLEEHEPCGCCYISGCVDGIDLKNLVLQDYKTIGDQGVCYIRSGAKEPHVFQVNLYRLMLSNGLARVANEPSCISKKEYKLLKKKKYIVKDEEHGYTRVNIPINKMRVVYLTMMKQIPTGGTYVEKTKYVSKEPTALPEEINREKIKSYFDGEAKAQYKITYKVPEVPLLDKEFILSKVNELRSGLITAFMSHEPPPMCDESMRWLCNGFCDVKTQCDYIEQNSGKIILFPMAD